MSRIYAVIVTAILFWAGCNGPKTWSCPEGDFRASYIDSVEVIDPIISSDNITEQDKGALRKEVYNLEKLRNEFNPEDDSFTGYSRCPRSLENYIDHVRLFLEE